MRQLGIRTAHGFLEELVRGSIFENASSEDYQKASLRVLRYKDQDITLVDAVIAEIADHLDAPVWTFDHHFDVMGSNAGGDQGPDGRRLQFQPDDCGAALC